MKGFRCLVLLIGVFCIVSVDALADETLPQWSENNWWTIQTHLDVFIKDPDSGDSLDMVIDDDAPQYTCQGKVSRTLTRGSKLTYDVYWQTYEGTITGEGTADVSLTDVEIPIELRNGTVTGETWVDTQSLGTVFTSRFITADLWAYYLFSWQKVGTAEIAISEEFEPERDLINFPLAVGNSWSQSITQFTYGRYIVDYDVGSGPQHMEDSFENETTFPLTFNIPGTEDYKSWLTYRSIGTAPDWSGQITSRYAPVAKNHAYVSMTNIDIPEDGILIREITTDLHDFDVTGPAPTPTPDPDEPGLSLHLNKDLFTADDAFNLSCTVVNNGNSIDVDQYILLDVYGLFYFWPGWSETVDFQSRNLEQTTVYPAENVLAFTWPEVDGSATGIQFWGALLESQNQQLFGSYDVIQWGWQ